MYVVGSHVTVAFVPYILNLKEHFHPSKKIFPHQCRTILA